MSIDRELMREVISYNQYKRYHFNHFIPFEHNDKYDKILNARYHKVSRIKRKFLYILEKKTYFYFLTFTFSDEYLKNCDRTKKDLIKKCLYSFDKNCYMILNKDFGGKNDREHYHCIYGTDNNSNLLDHIKKNYPFRFQVQHIHFNRRSITKISKYMNKLTNHCVKDTAYSSRIYIKIK